MGATFPDWFPLYPGVDKKDVMALPLHGEVEMTSGSFRTVDPPEKVIEFYQNAFKTAGFTVKQTKEKEGPKITAKNHGKEATVDASAKDSGTLVGFTFSEKK